MAEESAIPVLGCHGGIDELIAWCLEAAGDESVRDRGKHPGELIVAVNAPRMSASP